MNNHTNDTIYDYAAKNFDREHVCPYCMFPLDETWRGCCGEAGHGIDVFMHPDTGDYIDPDDDNALKDAVNQYIMTKIGL